MSFRTTACLAGMIAAASLVLGAAPACAAELVMFERAGCIWCQAFDREVAPIYVKTPEGRRFPLRRVDIARPVPDDLRAVDVERITPVFVLVDDGREVGRIRGYPGEESFWALLAGLVRRFDERTPGSARNDTGPAGSVAAVGASHSTKLR